MSARDDRGPWYLLTGLFLGVMLGLLISWRLAPVQYVNTAPNTLRDDFKDQFRVLVAAAYAANLDIAQARSRLAYLGDADAVAALTDQAQRAALTGRPQAEIAALTSLALAIQQPAVNTPVAASETPPTLAPSPNPTSPPTATTTPEVSPTPVVAGSPQASGNTPRPPTSTPTPLPTRTATPTPANPFALQSKRQVCNQKLEQPLIQVQTRDAASQPASGVEIIVFWDGGEEHFFTGLKPELGLGYADFTMTPGVTYAARLAASNELVADLTAHECEAAGGVRYWGGWLLVFVRP